MLENKAFINYINFDIIIEIKYRNNLIDSRGFKKYLIFIY